MRNKRFESLETIKADVSGDIPICPGFKSHPPNQRESNQPKRGKQQKGRKQAEEGW